jgi:predicted RNase H-like nuclease (RuvC/YqgF family)
MKRKNQVRRQQESLKAYQSLKQEDQRARTAPNVNSLHRKPSQKKKNGYKESEVIAFLEKRGCRIEVGRNYTFINIEKARNLGNGCWGRLSFLENYCNIPVVGKSVYKANLTKNRA